MTVFYRLLKPLLFLLDAERAHGLVGAGLLLWSRLFPRPRHPGLPARWIEGGAGEPALASTHFGLRFPSPIGLAAGMDKGEVVAPAFFRLGFGFVEIGSITPRPQQGNLRPRLFRLVEEQAVINRMGFNNAGAALVAERLRRLPPQPGPIGVNLGKNKDTPNELAAEDYLLAFASLAPLADYVAVNVSSPNTPGLRALQGASELRALVSAVAQARDALASRPGGKRVPLLVKLSPDEPGERLAAIAEAAVEAGADGLIATNTTLSREGVTGHPLAGQQGGLSGAPLRAAALLACARLYLAVGKRVPIIGVGGIFTAEDAYARLRAGASLVQIYTALVYRGPEVARSLAQGLRALLARDGETLAGVVGRDSAAICSTSR